MNGFGCKLLTAAMSTVRMDTVRSSSGSLWFNQLYRHENIYWLTRMSENKNFNHGEPKDRTLPLECQWKPDLMMDKINCTKRTAIDIYDWKSTCCYFIYHSVARWLWITWLSFQTCHQTCQRHWSFDWIIVICSIKELLQCSVLKTFYPENIAISNSNSASIILKGWDQLERSSLFSKVCSLHHVTHESALLPDLAASQSLHLSV